jgi:hypothetical protein
MCAFSGVSSPRKIKTPFFFPLLIALQVPRYSSGWNQNFMGCHECSGFSFTALLINDVHSSKSAVLKQ